jgi:hypothetical protein
VSGWISLTEGRGRVSELASEPVSKKNIAAFTDLGVEVVRA